MTCESEVHSVCKTNPVLGPFLRARAYEERDIEVIFRMKCGEGDGCEKQDQEKLSNFRKHINILWDEYYIFMQNKIYNISEENPFQNWKIDQRYTKSENITEDIVRIHMNAITKINNLIKQAELDGVF